MNTDALKARADQDITLELDHMRLVVNPFIGCSIMSLEIKDPTNRSDQWTPVLRSMPCDAGTSSDAGSFAMLPWTNRIKDARFVYRGDEYSLSTNMNDGSAIHGVGRDFPWKIIDRSPITARFMFDSRSVEDDRMNYPFKFGAVQRFEIGPDRVEIDLSVTNLDERAIPVGCGHHPYIHRHLFSQMDDLRVQLDLAGRYPAQGCIPDGEPIFDSSCEGFKRGDPIGNPGLDDVFSGFGGVAVFDWAASNVRMTMECTDNLDHVVIYTPKEANGEPNEFVCVEPVTMVNDGFNRLENGHQNTGVRILSPNETLRTRMTLSFGGCDG